MKSILKRLNYYTS